MKCSSQGAPARRPASSEMIMRYSMSGAIVIAVDHSGVTLRRYLNQAGHPSVPASALRFKLLSCLAQLPVDGSVVRVSDAKRVTRNLSSTAGVLLGLKDMRTVSELLRALEAVPRHTGSARADPPLVKVGLYVDDASSTAVDMLKCLDDVNWMKLVIEPYFAASLKVHDRASFLRQARKLGNVAAFKLDVAAPKETAGEYSAACGTVPWLARSEGLQFEAFLDRFSTALDAGCTGAIVGAAVWRSEIGRLLSAKYFE
jgi:hypothetical protein